MYLLNITTHLSLGASTLLAAGRSKPPSDDPETGASDTPGGELAETAPSSDDPQVRLNIQGECADGYIDRIEIRTIKAGAASAWRRAPEVGRDGGSLGCMITMSRGDTELLLQARAIDGQGVVDPTPASFTLR